LRGNGAYGNADDLGWEGEVGRFEQGEEVFGGGAAGKRNGIRQIGWIAQAGADGFDGAGGDDVAVDGDGGDVGSGVL
jgi:hypothetical protein